MEREDAFRHDFQTNWNNMMQKQGHWRATLAECLIRNDNARNNKEKVAALRDLREIKLGIQDSIRRKYSLKGRVKSVQKRRLSKEKSDDNFKIQTTANPFLQSNRNYFKDYVLGEWNE